MEEIILYQFMDKNLTKQEIEEIMIMKKTAKEKTLNMMPCKNYRLVMYSLEKLSVSQEDIEM